MKHTLLLPAAVVTAIASTAANAQTNRPVTPVPRQPVIGNPTNPGQGGPQFNQRPGFNPVNPGVQPLPGILQNQNPNIGVNPGFGPGSPNFGGNSQFNYGPSFGPGAPNFGTPGYSGNGFFGQQNGFGSFGQTPFGQTPFATPGFSGAFFNPYGYVPYGGGVYDLTPRSGTLGIVGSAPVPNIAGQLPGGVGTQRPNTGPVLVAPGATSRVGAGAAGSILPGDTATTNGAGDVRPGGGISGGGAPGGGIPATGPDPLTAPVQTAPATPQQQALARQASQQMAQGPMRQGRLVSRNKSTALVTYTVDGQLQSARVPLSQVYFFQPGGAMATIATNPNTLEAGNRVMIPDTGRSMVAGSRQESRVSPSSKARRAPRR